MTHTDGYVCPACGEGGFSWSIWHCACDCHYPLDTADCPACGDMKPGESPKGREPAGEIIALPMNAEQAARLTERIKSSIDNLWELIVEAHDGKAWKALGYESWKGYVTKEFAMSESYSYRLIDKGKVIKALSAATQDSPIGEVSEYQARRIKPRLQEVTERVEAKVAEGVDPKEAIREVVDKLDEPITEPLVVNGQSYITAEAVAHSLAEAKANDSTVPLSTAMTQLLIAEHNSTINDLMDALGEQGREYMSVNITRCIQYLMDVSDALFHHGNAITGSYLAGETGGRITALYEFKQRDAWEDKIKQEAYEIIRSKEGRDNE